MNKELVEKIEKQLENAEQVWNEYLNEGTVPYALVECPEDELECVYSDESIELEEEVYEIDVMESEYLKPENLRLYLQMNVSSCKMRLEMAKEL